MDSGKERKTMINNLFFFDKNGMPEKVCRSRSGKYQDWEIHDVSPALAEGDT